MLTALIIALLIVAGAATVVGGGLILATQRRRELGAGGDAAMLEGGGAVALLERSVHELRVGDVVQTDGRDFLVEGLIRYDEAGHQWRAGRIVDGRVSRWLVVGLDRGSGDDTWLYDVDDELELSEYPPEILLVGGERYSFDKRGTATTRLVGDVGTLGGTTKLADSSVHRCRWWLYRAAGDAALIVEQWGDDYRVLRGKRASDADLELIPGS